MKNYGDLWVTERLMSGERKILTGSGEVLGSITDGATSKPLWRWRSTCPGPLTIENLRDILSIMRAIENGDQ